MFQYKKLLVAGLCLAMTACTGMTSGQPGSDGDVADGMTYYLPTTLIPLTIQVDAGKQALSLVAGQPVYIPDQTVGEMRLRSVYSPLHAETVHLTTTANGLLTNISFESDARLDETLVNLARSAGAIFRPESNLQQGQAITVLRLNLDLAELSGTGLEPKPKLAKLNQQIQTALDAALRSKGAGLAANIRASGKAPITLAISRVGGSPATVPETDDRDKCHVGFCYRRPVPYLVTATFFDGSVQETIVQVPNGAPVRAARLDRGLFTKWTSIMVLNNGVLTSFKTETDASEAERLALLPFELVGGAVEGITRQGGLWDAASTTLEKRLAYAEAIAKARTDALAAEAKFQSTPLFRLTNAAAASSPQGNTNGSGSNLNQNQQSGSQGPSGSAQQGSTGREN